jgi:hypothetical protein
LAVKRVFAKDKSRYVSVFQMERKLAEEGLTPQEAKQAISIAKAKQEIGMCYPPQRELCYELLTEEDRKLENRLISAVRKVFDKKGRNCKVEEMKQRLLEENLTPDEAEQAISIAQANQVIRSYVPDEDEIHEEPSYELLTEEDLKMEEELEEELESEKEYQRRKKKERTDKKTKKGRR